MSVLIVGSVALDTIESPAGRVDEALGGAAVFSSLAARLCHDSVAIVGVTGDDFPSEHVELLRSRGVNLAGLSTVPGRTFRWSGRYHADLNRRDTLDTQLNVFADFDPQVPDDLRDAEYVFLANIDPTLQLSVLNQIRAPKLVLCDSMNFWIESKRDALVEVLKRADIVFLNDEEVRMLTGHIALPRAAQAVLGLGPSRAIIKKGEHGAEVHSGDGVFHCPAVPLFDVVDPTGAGDSFAGGMIGCLARARGSTDEDVRRAVVYGTLLASFTVEGFSVSGLLRATGVAMGERYTGLQRMTAIPPP